jgi:transcriptional regulator with XRE-family HTH domain
VNARGTSRYDPAVGRRLRELRESRGITLSGLARTAGLGKATLSGLENGSRNPTLETMYAIAAALGVPISVLTLDRGAPVSAASPVRGEAVEATLLEVFEEAAATFELLRMRVIAGREQSSPAHPPGVTEHVTVFQGVLRAGPADAPLLAHPGQHIAWTADVPHTYAAVGDEDVAATLLIRTPRPL